jgi:alcohol dehydrogenase class IV
MLGALLAGQGSDYVGGGLAQALAHTAGPRSSTSNGVVEAILLPHTTRFTAYATPGRLSLIEAALPPAAASSETNVERAIASIEQFLSGLGVPRRLTDVGLTREDLREVADHTVDDWTLTRIPRCADRADLLGLLEAAW